MVGAATAGEGKKMLDLTGNIRDREKNCISQMKYLEKLYFFQVWRERQRNGEWTGSHLRRAGFWVNGFCYICFSHSIFTKLFRRRKGDSE